MRVLVDGRGRIANPDFLHQLQCPLPGNRAGHLPVIAQGLRQLPAHRHVGIEAGHWVLEHHGNIAAANFTQLGLG